VRNLFATIHAVDAAAYRAVAETERPAVDTAMARLSNAANHSRLWLVMAAGLAVLGGSRGRRAAGTGVAAIGATSALVNLAVKPIFVRTRPATDARPGGVHVRMPKSASFPSGHSASAFAFASAVGGLPLGVLAGAVAYSRVHTGVHYPGDVLIGSLIGAVIGRVTRSVLKPMPRPVPARAPTTRDARRTR
jgi:membrane-associated phospholipid phosphatase